MGSDLKIAVTGASGFVGNSLTRRLCNRGHRLVCLLRPSSKTVGLDHPGIEVRRGDLTDACFVNAALKDCAALVHSAAMVSDWGTVREIRTANVHALEVLLREAERIGIQHFIHISTTDVYGYPGLRDVSEDMRLAPRFSNWYSHTKKEAEFLVRQSALSYTILRPATVYGPGSETLVGEIAKAVQNGFMLLVNGGRSVAGLTYIDHVVDAIETALLNESAFEEVFNIADASPVTWAEFVDRIADGLKVKYRKIELPLSAAYGLGMAMEVGYRHIRGLTGMKAPALLSRQAVHILGIDQHFSIEKAQRHLGFTPTVSFEEGMEKTIKWVSSRYGLS